MTGTHTRMLKGHSTHAASTTKADVRGFSVCGIMKQEQWSKKSIIQKLYKKEIIDHIVKLFKLLS